MPTVIDSLIVTLGLDNKDFELGRKDSEKGFDSTKDKARKTAKDIEKSGRDAAEFFGQMQRAAIKFFAVLTVGKGLINFTRDVVTTGANLSRLSQNMGLSTDTMHRWGKATELNGGSMEGFLGTLQNLNAQITEIQMTGTSAMLPYLRQLGVGITDAEGKAKPLTDLLADIADATEKAYKTQPERYAYLKRMGLDEGTINLMSKGGAELRKTLSAQSGFSKANADAALKAEQTWIKTQQRLETMTRELVVKVLPALERLANSFVNMAEVVIPPLSAAIDIFVSLDEATNGWSTSLILALGTLRLITGGAILGGLSTAAASIASMAASLSPVLALVYSKSLNSNEEEWLAEMRGEKEFTPTIANKLGATIAERNNNPGNLVWAGQKGAVKGETVNGHTFAKFESQQAGIQALHKQLQAYQARGIDTLGKIMEIYAPRSTNNTDAYINYLSQSTGLDPSKRLNFNDPVTAAAMIQGLSQYEAGKAYLSKGDILSGIGAGSMGQGGNTTVSVGQITVNTQATDAKGIASAIKGEIVRQFDPGVQ